MNIKEIYNQHPYKEIMLFSGLLEVPTELYQRKLDHDRANRIAETLIPVCLMIPRLVSAMATSMFSTASTPSRHSEFSTTVRSCPSESACIST